MTDISDTRNNDFEYIVCMKVVYKEFGERLDFLRKYRKYTKFRLAAESGVDRSYLNDLIKGKYAASIEIISKLSLVLNVPMKEFLEFSDKEPISGIDFPEE